MAVIKDMQKAIIAGTVPLILTPSGLLEGGYAAHLPGAVEYALSKTMAWEVPVPLAASSTLSLADAVKNNQRGLAFCVHVLNAFYGGYPSVVAGQIGTLAKTMWGDSELMQKLRR